MTQPESLSQKLDRLDQRVAGLTEAVRHSATKRSTIALSIAMVGIFALFIVGIGERSISRHQDCVRDNKLREAIALENRLLPRAFTDALVQVLVIGRSAEDMARIKAQGEALIAGYDLNPQVREARADLAPRSCSYWPF